MQEGSFENRRASKVPLKGCYIAGLPQSPIVYSPYASDGTRKSDDDMIYGIGALSGRSYNRICFFD